MPGISRFVAVARMVLVVLAVLVLAASTLGVFAQEKGPYDTSRVVAIGGSLTEIVYLLGEQERLVARDSTSVYPDEALALRDVGYMRALSPEGVLSVQPSLILMLAGSGPPETIEVLEKASVPVVMVPERFDRAGILAKVEAVGKALGVGDRARELAARVEADTLAAENATAGIAERARILFVLSMQGGRILAAGTGTAADGVIAMAGAENAVTGYAGYKQLSDEAVIEAAPDVILAMERGGGGEIAADELLAHPAIAATPAGRDGRVIRMDGSFLLGFGPRTASAVRELAHALYGDAVVD